MKSGWRLLVGLLLGATATVAASHSMPPTRAGAIRTDVAIEASQPALEALTVTLLDARSRHAAAQASEKGQRLGELLQAAKTRADALSATLKSDPAAVLRVALPESLRGQFPAQAAQFLEQDLDTAGELEVLHVDFPDHVNDHYVFTLKTPTEELNLYFAAEMTELPSGTHVRVRGIRLDDDVVLTSIARATTAKAATLSNTFGAQKTLVILVNFADLATQPFTAATAQSVVFTDTSNFDYAGSYQQTWLTGAVAGWFTIASSYTTCDYSTIAAQAKQAATAAGVTLSNYNRYVYAFPGNACTWWGLGSVGGNPSQAWVNTKWGFTMPVVAHEMGHNLGLYHSHSLDCGAAVVGGTCTTSDYGDVFDVMGQATSSGHFNAFQKERLGWLNSGVSPPLLTVPAQGGTVQYSIGAYEAARSTTPRALKIPNSSACATGSQYYYVEARQAVSGVVMHQATPGSGDSSYLLDMTPNSTSFADGGLLAGQTFTDPTQGISISPVATSASGATINVTFPGASCTHVAPKVTVTPGGTVWSAAGAIVRYTVTLTNNDTCACSASAFVVTASVPAGWSANSTTTAAIAAGASTTATIDVQVPTGSASGFYNVSLNAANSAAPAVTASAASTIALSTSLTVSVATSSASYSRPKGKNQVVNAPITTTVTNGGGGAAGAGVSAVVTDPLGVNTTLTGTTGSNGTATFSYPLRATSALGTYAVTSTATAGSISGTATTTFRVK
jgi:hypothetical protein